jgi:hypothetical protein
LDGNPTWRHVDAESDATVLRETLALLCGSPNYRARDEGAVTFRFGLSSELHKSTDGP